MHLEARTHYSVLKLLVRRQEGHQACKKLAVGMLSVIIWPYLSTSYGSSCHHHLHHLCFNKIQIGTSLHRLSWKNGH